MNLILILAAAFVTILLCIAAFGSLKMAKESGEI